VRVCIPLSVLFTYRFSNILLHPIHPRTHGHCPSLNSHVKTTTITTTISVLTVVFSCQHGLASCPIGKEIQNACQHRQLAAEAAEHLTSHQSHLSTSICQKASMTTYEDPGNGVCQLYKAVERPHLRSHPHLIDAIGSAAYPQEEDD